MLSLAMLYQVQTVLKVVNELATENKEYVSKQGIAYNFNININLNI